MNGWMVLSFYQSISFISLLKIQKSQDEIFSAT